ncbi:MAG: T9SS type A sorting domain-containing protein, partial [Bacteroidota bacterium]
NGGTGSVALSATGGTGSYTYNATATTNLTAGTYNYTVTDANGCSASVSATINAAPSAVILSAIANQILCNGGTGGVSLTANGGTGSFTYGGDATTNLTAGTYNYTVTDANGCSASASATINAAPAALNLTATASQILCNGGTGSVALIATGGTAPYSYNGTSTSLTAGAYNYTVTDANGCSAIASATINSAPSALTLTATANQILCNGSTGSVSLTANGGTGSYTFNGTTTNLIAGTYTYTVTDANGCTKSATATINAAPAPITGTMYISACSFYTWTANNVTYTQSGSYSTVLTAANGCDSTATLVLSVTPQPAAPTGLACYQTATFNYGTCQWVVTGLQPAMPTLACYQTATFNTTSCQWDVTGSPASSIVTNANGCDTYTWSANGQTYTQSGTYTYYANCQDYTLNLTITVSTVYYADVDNDGYGNSASTMNSCTGAPAGYVAIAGDCNDNNASVNPNATEICNNGIDDNCNGLIDEGCECINPPTANAGSNVTVCAGSNIQLSGSFGGSATTATWSTSGTGTFTPSANALNAIYVPSSADNTIGSVTLTLTTNAFGLCTEATSTITLTFVPLPEAPSAISGATTYCNPGSLLYTYSITPVSGASSYTWTTSPGITIIGNATGSSVQIKFVDSYVQVGLNGVISVTPNNSNGCFNSTSSSINVLATVAAPVTPPSISGPDRACVGDVYTYSISSVARASQYNWTMPTGATIVTGAGTNIISVSYGASFVGGNITVTASNLCGTSAARSRSVSRNVLSAPGAITGPIDGLCGTSNVTYSVSPMSGATSYVWTVPTGATISGTSTSNSITVNFRSSFTSGNITVAANNGCGTGSARSLAVKSTPAIPAVINGPVTVCVNSTQTYSTTTVQGATSYAWTVPGGAVINAGQGSKIISMTYGPTASANGIVTVKASNSCGISNVRVLAVISTVCPRIGTSLAIFAYPNPVQSNLTVEFTAEESQNVNMSMRDASGRVVYAEMKAVAAGANANTIDVSTFAKGIYLLQVQSNNNTETLRVIVE